MLEADCRPPVSSMVLLRLQQRFETGNPDEVATRARHVLTVRNLDPAAKQEVTVTYNSDSSQARFCECGVLATCVPDHAEYETNIRTRGNYWYGEEKTLHQGFSWYLTTTESDFTL